MQKKFLFTIGKAFVVASMMLGTAHLVMPHVAYAAAATSTATATGTHAHKSKVSTRKKTTKKTKKASAKATKTAKTKEAATAKPKAVVSTVKETATPVAHPTPKLAAATKKPTTKKTTSKKSTAKKKAAAAKKTAAKPKAKKKTAAASPQPTAVSGSIGPSENSGTAIQGADAEGSAIQSAADASVLNDGTADPAVSAYSGTMSNAQEQSVFALIEQVLTRIGTAFKKAF